MTPEERETVRELMKALVELERDMKKNKGKKGELRGGVFPFLLLLANLAARAIPFALNAARVVLPTIARGAINFGSRALPTIARGATQAFTRGVQATRGLATRVLPKTGKEMARGVLTRTAQTAPRTTAEALKQGAKGLLKKVNTAVTIGSTGNLIYDTATGDVGFEDTPDETAFADDYNPPLHERPLRQPHYPHGEGYVPPPVEAPEPEVDIADEEEQPAQAFNLAPLRYNPRIRNVFTAGESLNPLRATRPATSVPSQVAPVVPSRRDINVLRGSGITFKRKVLKRYGLPDKGYSLDELADITGVPEPTLQEVYNRGIGAYKTNPRSVRMKVTFKKNVDAPMSQKLSKEQWAMARVWSFLAGNPRHDSDLRI